MTGLSRVLIDGGIGAERVLEGVRQFTLLLNCGVVET